MDIREHVIKLNETRLRVWEEGKALLDDVAGREMTSEERQKWERINERIDEIDGQVRSFVDRENRERENAVAIESIERQYGTVDNKPAVRTDARQSVYDWARGAARRTDDPDEPGKNAIRVNLRAAQREIEAIRQGASAQELAELRSLLWDTGSSASLVPTDQARELYQHMTANVALLRMPTTKIFTDNGNPIDFPKVNAHGIATAVIAQGTAIGGTDPTFARMRLDAYKRGQLLQLAAETITDAGVDIVNFVFQNIGRAVGERVATDFAVGSGSSEPNGVMTAVTGSGTIATGGSLIDPTVEKLIDLQYSVNSNYRDRTSAAWLMHDLTAGVIRKLRDGEGGTVGAFLWQPSLTAGIQGGQPDRLFNAPVWTDPNVASLASNAKVIAYGDFSAFYIRQVGDFVIERSDDYAFNTDLVTFRGKARVDSDLIDSNAINIIKRSV